MFQFPGLALSEESDGALPPPGFPIRTPVGHSLRAALHRFSQLATSFLACPRLGIPRVLLPRLAMPLSATLQLPHDSKKGHAPTYFA